MRLIFLFLVALGCGILTGIIAYLITYNEYQHHFKGKRIFQESIKSAVIAFIFFFILTIVLVEVIPKLIEK